MMAAILAQSGPVAGKAVADAATLGAWCGAAVLVGLVCGLAGLGLALWRPGRAESRVLSLTGGFSGLLLLVIVLAFVDNPAPAGVLLSFGLIGLGLAGMLRGEPRPPRDKIV